MSLFIVRKKLTDLEVDIIVDTDKSKMEIANTTNTIFYEDDYLTCVLVKPDSPLKAKYIIRSINPINWNDEQVLIQFFNSTLALAITLNTTSIAFPFSATLSDLKSFKLGYSLFKEFLINNDIDIFLLPSKKIDLELNNNLDNSISQFIEYHYVKPTLGKDPTEESFKESFFSVLFKRKKKASQDEAISHKGLQESFQKMDAGFSESLVYLINESGKTEAEIYKKANIDRKHFSKIRNNLNYKPSKTTAIGFAIALELDLERTKEFISRAGFALSRSNIFDIIVEYFIINRNYNIFELNEVLYMYDQQVIGLL